MTAADLSPAGRAGALAAARAHRFDVAVVGGGVTGAGVALDAAARGLSVVLLEAGDLASGTSSRSGKTVHGGLRYLEQLNFRLVAEALHERDLMVRTLAPHLVTPEPFLFPLTRRWERPYVGAGVLLYDLMAAAGRTGGRGGVPHHRHLSRRGVLREAPGLDPDVVTGALQYYDGRMDDARHTLAVARTAAAHGALVLSHAPVVDVLREGPRVGGVRVEDAMSGERFEVGASVVVNAAGVWAADVQAMAGAATFAVRPAKGVHLLVERSAFDSRTGILARAEDSVIILRRWFGHWLLGTTDTAWTGERRAPTVAREDVDYLLRNVNRYLARPLSRADVLGTFAGLRPLLAPVARDAQTTSALSRDHAVIEEPAGMVTVVGGKYTTYRRMARDAVDAAGRALGADLPPTPTAQLPLVGAAGWRATGNRVVRLAAEHGVGEEHVRRMLHRYGDELADVLAPVRDDAALGRPLPGADDYLPVEFRRAVTHEGALTLADVLHRRTHLAIERPDAGLPAAPAVAALLAPLLGWDADRQAREVAAYRAEVERDRAGLADDGATAAVPPGR
ncbi:glycerol-3-phosphate dehydrogenase/oxidase [Pseudonocardia kunmingensis]|uniref:Glycerol-3-phosphate dehydrogenase n=1 Tax=Pseudonocardia kunmingensis TaxID=630975 RepID=A0A543DXA4_9PSEU|nr:glycerol-3-phosphate dehydrogenase/oxidase [Pseudonocardia kunmingensis]TQM13951.1 glycerol-3-phosphate dehydrogenase [Pseudonocardia kunmingensis]